MTMTTTATATAATAAVGVNSARRSQGRKEISTVLLTEVAATEFLTTAEIL